MNIRSYHNGVDEMPPLYLWAITLCVLSVLVLYIAYSAYLPPSPETLHSMCSQEFRKCIKSLTTHFL